MYSSLQSNWPLKLKLLLLFGSAGFLYSRHREELQVIKAVPGTTSKGGDRARRVEEAFVQPLDGSPSERVQPTQSRL